MSNYRIFVEKKDEFKVEAVSLLNDFNENLGLNLKYLRLINIYDVFNISEETLIKAKKNVFSEIVTDYVYDEIDLKNETYFAVEFLPGQYDQRADSARQCIKLLDPHSNVEIRSGKLIIIDSNYQTSLDMIKNYYINKIESREKDLSKLIITESTTPRDITIFDGFINFNDEELNEFLLDKKFAMNIDDLKHIQNYFKNEEKRNPTETEIFMLDTYWSDHCRHTTFETLLTNVIIEKGQFSNVIQNTFNKYLELREKVHNNRKPMTLMDMATINGKYERLNGNLEDVEISDEINACSIYVDVDCDGVIEKWLLMFKNETHNHPTEIEPFGGASTCVGGAIRDPLSGRSYVYQAMRISGSGNVLEDVKDTLPNKLPQKRISKGAADGYSSYGNQIGLATTYVKEIYHPNYVAKHLEVGAVVGAAKASNVVRKEPVAGDIIILIGGRTGRDGIGGATGSSKEHDDNSLNDCAAEVQKGNAPEERKIQRLFRNPDVTSLIKKSNDFGAGGVSVAIGELADGLIINLDKVPTKYSGLNGTEIAISESQERMAVVVSSNDVEGFINLTHTENLEATVVAEVTDTNRLVMYWRNQKIVDLSRDFIDTNGVRQSNDVFITTPDNNHPFTDRQTNDLKSQVLETLSNLNIASQKGMQEMFDASIGSTTILMPYGGKYQLTPTQASVQKLPVLNCKTNTASILTYGYNPEIFTWSPFHGAAYSVVESIAKVIAVGGSYDNIHFTFQEYFERLNNDPKRYGKVTSALLGAMHVLLGFNRAAIGGKDSMSGTYKDIDVPPTLISFAVDTVDVNNVISPEFKQVDNYIYLIKHNVNKDLLPNIEELKTNFTFINENIKSKNIISAYTIETGGIIEALAKMSFGNKLGFTINTMEDLFKLNYGSFIVETNTKLDYENAYLLGKITNDNFLINEIEISKEEALTTWLKPINRLYPIYTDLSGKNIEINDYICDSPIICNNNINTVNVFIPVFPGTNCEYDSYRAFKDAGGNPEIMVFRNQTEEDIIASVNEMVEHINKSHIIMFSGGFSSGDEPDGSAKFIVNILKNELVTNAIHKFLDRDGLILGICNGFQALIKSGLLPYGRIIDVNDDSPTLVKNNINRHISSIVTTRVTSNKSPWLKGLEVGSLHKIAVSHGEGKFVGTEQEIKRLFENGQVSFQYTNLDGNPTMDGKYNLNGSYYAIEGITSPCGRILGKMGHSERFDTNNFINIPGNKEQNIFKNGVNYFLNK